LGRVLQICLVRHRSSADVSSALDRCSQVPCVSDDLLCVVLLINKSWPKSAVFRLYDSTCSARALPLPACSMARAVSAKRRRSASTASSGQDVAEEEPRLRIEELPLGLCARVVAEAGRLSGAAATRVHRGSGPSSVSRSPSARQSTRGLRPTQLMTAAPAHGPRLSNVKP